MNVLVMASSIKMGGARTIYNQFIQHLPRYIGDDRYLIYISDKLETPHIENVEYVVDHNPNGLRRLMYEHRHLHEDLTERGFKPDVVISLQNNGYKNIKDCRQIVYYHQALPLYPSSYNPLNKSERRLFYYHYIYPRIMKHTWAANTEFVVQTPVVKERFVRTFGIDAAKVNVNFPDVDTINAEEIVAKDFKDGKFHFLFVGDGFKYRNFTTIVKAIKRLYETDATLAAKVAVHITKTAESEPRLATYIDKLGIRENFIFESRMSQQELYGFYKSQAALLSPSTIETVGLPMLEAASLGIPVVSSDLDFAHYVIGEYEGTHFVSPYDVNGWCQSIMDICKEVPRHKPYAKTIESGWENFFGLYADKKQ